MSVKRWCSTCAVTPKGRSIERPFRLCSVGCAARTKGSMETAGAYGLGGPAHPTSRRSAEFGEIRRAPLDKGRQRFDGLRRAQALAEQRALLLDHPAQLVTTRCAHQALAVGYRRGRQVLETQSHLAGLGQGRGAVLQGLI